MFKSDLKEVAEARKAINCLQVEVAAVIALDISKKVEAAFEAIAAQQAVQADAKKPIMMRCLNCGCFHVGDICPNCNNRTA